MRDFVKMSCPPLATTSALIILLLVIIPGLISHSAALSLQGVRCGSARCSLRQSCSPYSSLCEDCGSICAADSHNHEAERCERDCQAYLLDQRYVLKSSGSSSDFDIREELIRLRAQQRATLAACSVLAVLLLLLLLIWLLRAAQRRGVLDKEWFRDKLHKKSPVSEGPTIVQNPHTASPVLGSNQTRRAGPGSNNDLKLHIPRYEVGNVQQSNAPGTQATTVTPFDRHHHTATSVISGWSDTADTESSRLATPSTATVPAGPPPPPLRSTRHPAEDASLVYRTATTTNTATSNGGGGGGCYDNKAMTMTPSPGGGGNKLNESAF